MVRHLMPKIIIKKKNAYCSYTHNNKCAAVKVLTSTYKNVIALAHAWWSPTTLYPKTNSCSSSNMYAKVQVSYIFAYIGNEKDNI